MKISGIDLHSNNSVVVVSDAEDRIVLKRRLSNELGAILAALALPSCGAVVADSHLRFSEKQLMSDRSGLRFSALRLTTRRINDVTFAKDLCGIASPASTRRFMLCSSCMQENLHVQFFGGSTAER